jgi:hypothetical protein
VFFYFVCLFVFVCVCFLFCDSMLRFEFAACDFLFLLSTVVPLFVVVSVILDAGDRKQEREKMFI